MLTVTEQVPRRAVIPEPVDSAVRVRQLDPEHLPRATAKVKIQDRLEHGVIGHTVHLRLWFDGHGADRDPFAAKALKVLDRS